MSAPKHTPGPWQINGSHIYSADPEREIIAQAQAPNLIANAHLIAAAPEMLESLKDLMGLLDEGFLVRNTDLDAEPGFAMRMLGPMAKLKAALVVIDKAEGKENYLPVSKEGA